MSNEEIVPENFLDITPDVLDVNEISAKVTARDCGAVSIFTGKFEPATNITINSWVLVVASDNDQITL